MTTVAPNEATSLISIRVVYYLFLYQHFDSINYGIHSPNSVAMLLPIPDPPPVTSATLP